MSERDDERAFEARTKATFERSVDALDAATRSRLTRARVRALEAPERRRFGGARWLVPAGAAAAAAVAAWLVLVPRPVDPERPLQAADFGDLELVLAEEDLELIEELDFYAWLEEQPEFNAGGNGAIGDGVG